MHKKACPKCGVMNSARKVLCESCNVNMHLEAKAYEVDMSDGKGHMFKSGAKRSKLANRFDLIPSAGISAIASRFQAGSIKYGDNNWKQAIAIPDDAKAFAVDAFNHAFEHMLQMKDGVHDEDAGGNIGAVGWAMVVLAEIERLHGCKWTDL